MFLSAVTLKLCQGHKVLIRVLACPSFIAMQILIEIKLMVKEILSIISLFGVNLACFVCSDLEN